jgi:hypothetical protein
MQKTVPATDKMQTTVTELHMQKIAPATNETQPTSPYVYGDSFFSLIIASLDFVVRLCVFRSRECMPFVPLGEYSSCRGLVGRWVRVKVVVIVE